MGLVAQHQSLPAIGSTVFDIVKDLRTDADSLAFPIPVSSAEDAHSAKKLLLAQLDDHLLPRLAELSTPAVVVVAGSTGAGKSTITNSLVGEEISDASILRPTTLEPILVVHPRDEELMRRSPLVGEVLLKTHEGIPRGIAVLDAPDLDSIREENRETARRLLESADLWLFVTTSQRYGDALPWKTLISAKERGTSVAMILNRAPKASVKRVRLDLHSRLRDHGMEKTPLFVVEDQGPHEGLLPSSAIAPIRNWLTTLSGADQARAVIVRTLRGALDALPPRLLDLATATEEQVAAQATIDDTAKTSLMASVEKIRAEIADHTLFGGAGNSQWSLFATQARLDKAIGRSGYVQGSNRIRRKREEAAQQALPSLRELIIQAGTDTIFDARQHVKAALEDVPGGTHIDVTAFPPRTLTIAEAVDEWLKDTTTTVEQFIADNATKQVACAVKGLSTPALTTILVAASLGLDDAHAWSRRILGNESDAIVEQATTALADVYDRLILGEYVDVVTQLEALDVHDESATRIRVRVAELKKLR
ncbi:GTPase [Timonella sp. A28]|uniref:GTPase n=1 Tax=Timonella sp. A28 TaxID=3442640 RepID=UPI003EB75829